MSYPGAPGGYGYGQGQPGYQYIPPQQQPAQGGYQYIPPGGAAYPPQGGYQPPYQQAPAAAPYPVGGGAPYQQAPAAAPYPVGGGSPYPPAQGQYPPPGGSPYPPAQAQYPPAGSPYPPAQGQYPPQGGSPYPPGQPQYPPAGVPPYQAPGAPYSPAPTASPTTPYHAAPGASPYPPQGPPEAAAPWTPPCPSQYKEIPTIFPTEDFDPSDDASVLRKAMKGVGTNEEDIIAVLARRTSEERQKIVRKYQQAYGHDLIKDLKSELGGKFEDVIIALMDPMPMFLAKELHEAMSGLGTNDRTLVEILCTRNNESLQAIKDAYKEHYGKDLEDALRGETSGKFRKLLISMCACARDEEEFEYDPEKAKNLALELNEAAEGMGTDEEEFNRILCSYSYPLLRCAFAEYRILKGKSFEDTVDSELSGDLKRGMMAVCKATENTAGFFAEELHDAMSGVGTKDRALIRLVVSRVEIDMGNIKQEYQRIYDKSLEKKIKGDISGDYKNLLVVMIED